MVRYKLYDEEEAYVPVFRSILLGVLLKQCLDMIDRCPLNLFAC